MDTQTVKQQEQVVVAEPRRNGHLWDHFPEPRGWAVHWDGFELAQSAQRNGHNTQYPIEPKGR